jgi:hypothetical protein
MSRLRGSKGASWVGLRPERESMSEHDEVLVALCELEVALEHGLDRAEFILRRARVVIEQRRRHLSFGEIAAHPGPLLSEMTSDHAASLSDAARRLRHAVADALRSEGMTMGRIGELFGVSRQRVSALLNEGGKEEFHAQPAQSSGAVDVTASSPNGHAAAGGRPEKREEPSAGGQ